MSYCRWSSDDFACDLYIYENVSGCWTICVAGSRYTASPHDFEYHENEMIPDDDFPHAFTITPEGMARKYDWLSENMEDVALPFSGETFDLPSPGECADKVEELVALGYKCPDYVVLDLRDEQSVLNQTGEA